MTTDKFIYTYSSGYYDVANNTNLYITGNGGFGGIVYAKYHSTITNDGRVNAPRFSAGVLFGAGGSLINGSFSYTNAFIRGTSGVVVAGGVGAVTNFGAIEGVSGIHGQGDGIDLTDGGSLTNGTNGDPSAFVEGDQGIDISGALGTVVNFGVILGQDPGAKAAVRLSAGGAVTNGGAGDFRATIQGGVGVDISGAVGGVANFGGIVGSVQQGVVLYSGGNVTNGSVTDTGAYIRGVQQGVGLVFSGTVTNFGALSGSGATHGDTGVQLNSGGRVNNGTAADRGASVAGYTGVLMNGYGEVFNYGAINGLGASTSESGIDMTAGGFVANGGPTDRTASIEGASGVFIKGGAGTIFNAGTIVATENAFGVDLAAGGYLRNGSRNNPSALIQGYAGLYLNGGSGANFGVISGVGDDDLGVKLGAGASIVNGAAGHAGALIEGYIGVYVAAGQAATVTNFGSIEGAGEEAVSFNSSTDVLNVEAGSTFVGDVLGGGGTLNLASGVGTLSALGGRYVTVSGSMAATTFTAFNSIEVGAGAAFTDKGTASISAGDTLTAAGSLTLAAVANAGTLSVLGGILTVTGAVSGTGHVTIAGGTADFASSFNQAVSFSAGAAVLELAKSQTYTATLTGFSKSGGATLDLVDIAFGGSTKATYAGTATSGVLTVTDGTHTAKINLKGNYLSSIFTVASDGHGGTDVKDPKAPAPMPAITPPHQLIAAMAAMGASNGETATKPNAWSASSVTVLAVPGHIQFA